ncbi:MAG: hypothetical protein ACI9IP_000129 [Arcticibacterium sp.]|jgi:hypothetical protein
MRHIQKGFQMIFLEFKKTLVFLKQCFAKKKNRATFATPFSGESSLVL